MSQMGGNMILMLTKNMRKIWVDVKIKLLEWCEQHWKAVTPFNLLKKQTKQNLQRNQKTKENEEESS